MFRYGRDYSDQVGERSEGQLCASLRWYDEGGGKLLLGPLVWPMWVNSWLVYLVALIVSFIGFSLDWFGTFAMVVGCSVMIFGCL